MSTGILIVVVATLTALTLCFGFAVWSFLRAWKNEGARAKAEVEPRVLKLVTETLYANNPESGERHELGRFKITIQKDGRGDSILGTNRSATTHGCVNNQHAPQDLQIRGALSEFKESFAELIATGQFSTIAQLVIDFIQQMDVDQPSEAHISR